jgi:hypothetical protein
MIRSSEIRSSDPLSQKLFEQKLIETEILKLKNFFSHKIIFHHIPENDVQIFFCYSDFCSITSFSSNLKWKQSFTLIFISFLSGKHLGRNTERKCRNENRLTDNGHVDSSEYTFSKRFTFKQAVGWRTKINVFN